MFSAYRGMKTTVPSTPNPQLDAQNSILKTFYLIFTLLFYQILYQNVQKIFFYLSGSREYAAVIL